MNKDQAKGAAKQVGGEMQEQAGKLTGSTEHRVKGQAKQIEGEAQKDMGDAKEAVRNERDESKHRDPGRH